MDVSDIVIVAKIGFFELLDTVKDSVTLPNKFKDVLEDEEFKNSNYVMKLNVCELKALHSVLRDASCDVYLHELLEKTSIELPTLEVLPRNPELEARIKKLKLEQENQAYRDMTRNVNLKQRHEDSGLSDFREDLKMIRAQVIAIINFVLTVGGSFTFGYKMVEYSLPQPHITAQVLIGLLLAVIVAIADLYFLIKHIQ